MSTLTRAAAALTRAAREIAAGVERFAWLYL